MKRRLPRYHKIIRTNAITSTQTDTDRQTEIDGAYRHLASPHDVFNSSRSSNNNNNTTTTTTVTTTITPASVVVTGVSASGRVERG